MIEHARSLLFADDPAPPPKERDMEVDPRALHEFAEAGLTPAPSTVVQAPHIAESPVNFECLREQILHFGDGPRR
jgi:flavin reductase (DIM6/NTAB) family NADH-FMN oxidoreductase RutF